MILYPSMTEHPYADINCTEPKLSKVIDHDPIYHFKAVVTCHLAHEKINLKDIKDAYRSDISQKGSQFVIHEQHAYDKNGMAGYWLNATQSYKSPNGPMAVRAEIILADDNNNNFFMELQSKSIVAEDDAKYDKSILNTLALQISTDSAELIVTKEIDVEEPWYAPQGIFFDTVETRLSESIAKAAMLHAKKIRGEKVDALRK